MRNRNRELFSKRSKLGMAPLTPRRSRAIVADMVKKTPGPRRHRGRPVKPKTPRRAKLGRPPVHPPEDVRRTMVRSTVAEEEAWDRAAALASAELGLRAGAELTRGPWLRRLANREAEAIARRRKLTREELVSLRRYARHIGDAVLLAQASRALEAQASRALDGDSVYASGSRALDGEAARAGLMERCAAAYAGAHQSAEFREAQAEPDTAD
jgi:hypothetical protein